MGDGGTRLVEMFGKTTFHVADPSPLEPADKADHAKVTFSYYAMEAGQPTTAGIAEVRRLLMKHTRVTIMDSRPVELIEDDHHDVLRTDGPELPQELQKTIHEIAAAIFDAAALTAEHEALAERQRREELMAAPAAATTMEIVDGDEPEELDALHLTALPDDEGSAATTCANP